jgi:ribonuclease P protein component
MLNKKNRIQKNAEFTKIFKRSRPIVSGHLMIRSVFSNNSDNTRFGFVISNKIEKRATRRNLLKRKLRAIAQSLISEIKSGYSVVVIVRPGYIYPYSFDGLTQDLVSGLKKAGVL